MAYVRAVGLLLIACLSVRRRHAGHEELEQRLLSSALQQRLLHLHAPHPTRNKYFLARNKALLRALSKLEGSRRGDPLRTEDVVDDLTNGAPPCAHCRTTPPLPAHAPARAPTPRAGARGID